MDAIDRVAEQLVATPWWLLAAIIVISRAPSWIRDWVAALRAVRDLRASDARSASD